MPVNSHNYQSKKADREVTSAFTLNQIRELALERAKSGENGYQLEIITALLMCALSIEAVLNHVGVYLFIEKSKEPHVWDAIERLSPRKKLEAIAERCNLRLDFGLKPFQDFIPMFKFRDSIVHAKTVKLAVENIQLPPSIGLLDDVPDLQLPWEQQCDIATANKWRESIYGMSDVLSTAAKCTDPLRMGDFSMWS